MFFDVSHCALVLLKGPDSLDLLHRISTNDLLHLSVGASSQTILTNEKGRIVEVVSVVRISADELLLAGCSSDDEGLDHWLNKFIIMEDAKTSIVKSLYKQLIITSSNTQILQKLMQLSSESVYAFKENWGREQWLRLIIRNGTIEFRNVLGSLHEGRDDEFDEYRIKAGIPAYPNELGPQVNPLEVNLAHLVSFTKGCYVGQEVIARLDTYSKVQKQLCRFRLNRVPQSVPAPIVRDGEEVGTLTSSIHSPAVGSAIGLGFLTVKAMQAGTSFQLVEKGIGLELQS